MHNFHTTKASLQKLLMKYVKNDSYNSYLGNKKQKAILPIVFSCPIRGAVKIQPSKKFNATKYIFPDCFKEFRVMQ